MVYSNQIPPDLRNATSTDITVSYTQAKEEPSDSLGKTLANWGWSVLNAPLTLPQMLTGFGRRLYNTYLIFKHGEFTAPILQNVSTNEWTSTFRSLLGTMHFVTHKVALKEFWEHYRKSQNGPWDMRPDQDRVFGPMLDDMFPGQTKEDDFLFTCYDTHVPKYRNPLMKFLNPQNISRHQPELQKIVDRTLKSWADIQQQIGSINATELTAAFTINVISQLLLGHPGPLEKYIEISAAIDTMSKFYKARLISPYISSSTKKKYDDAVKVVREAIEVAIDNKTSPVLGSLVDELKAAKANGMTDIQIRTTLFLTYVAGSETSSSLLNFILWKIGQDSAYQEMIFTEIRDKGPDGILKTVDDLINEALRVHPPGYITRRYPSSAATRYEVREASSTGTLLYQQAFPNKDPVFASTLSAARDPEKYPNPHEFNPRRLENEPSLSSASLPWYPFGAGKHVCPGQALALKEVRTLLISLIRQFTFEYIRTPGHEPKQIGFLVYKLTDDIHLKLTQRPVKKD